MAETIHWSIFSTPIGTCGVAWSGGSLVGVQLPEASEQATVARMRRRWPDGGDTEPGRVAAPVIAAIQRLLRGEGADFSLVPLRRDGVSPFHWQVYQITRTIPVGQTLTYGEVARRLGDVTLARAVGRALGENPWPLVIPCHRVIAAAGRPGGFSGGTGTPTKLRLLAIEGVVPGGQPSLFD